MRSHLLLLHGALGSSVQLEELARKLESKFNIILYNFTGHGGKSIPEEAFSIKMFAEEIKRLAGKSRIEPVDIFGYSMGGYAALYLARNSPHSVKRIFTLGTKFDWNPESSSREAGMLNAAALEEKFPSFAKSLADRHAPENWKIVAAKTAEMMLSLGNNCELNYEEMSDIDCNVRVAVGDKDIMVSISETEKAYRSLKNSSMLVLPETKHPIESVDTDRLSYEIEQFFTAS